MGSNDFLPAIVVQRVWRGVRARRRFTELLFATLQEQLREELVSELPAPLDEGAPAAALVAPSRRRAQTPSLEEAQEEASISQFFHPNGGAHDPQFGFDPSPPPLLRTPGSSDRMLQPAVPTERYASATGAQSPQRGASASANGGGHSRAGSGGAVPSALMRGESGCTSDAEDAEGLQLSDELASTMSTEALRDLASVLGRLSATRTKVLTSLVERRDELRHERAQRQTLVEQLLMQVDRSRRLRKVKAPGSRR